mmetsp:Transcript_26378/g.87444  ORF Transcript_26378/g.87444 Transcript_26378/m.87444 type:complete len:209 (+) Transcript_26378:306-932(+)
MEAPIGTADDRFWVQLGAMHVLTRGRSSDGRTMELGRSATDRHENLPGFLVQQCPAPLQPCGSSLAAKRFCDMCLRCRWCGPRQDLRLCWSHHGHGARLWTSPLHAWLVHSIGGSCRLVRGRSLGWEWWWWCSWQRTRARGEITEAEAANSRSRSNRCSSDGGIRIVVCLMLAAVVAAQGRGCTHHRLSHSDGARACAGPEPATGRPE